MKTFVGVTDNDWFAFLASLPEVDEVKFWQPTGNVRFFKVDPKEPLLFELYSCEIFISTLGVSVLSVLGRG